MWRKQGKALTKEEGQAGEWALWIRLAYWRCMEMRRAGPGWCNQEWWRLLACLPACLPRRRSVYYSPARGASPTYADEALLCRPVFMFLKGDKRPDSSFGRRRKVHPWVGGFWGEEKAEFGGFREEENLKLWSGNQLF